MICLLFNKLKLNFKYKMYHIYIMYYWYLWETHASTLRNKLYMNDHWPAYNHSTEYRGPSRVDDIIGIVVFDRYIDP